MRKRRLDAAKRLPRSARSSDQKEQHTEIDVVSLEVVHLALGKHGVVLEFGLTKRGGVRRDENELGLARAQSLDSGLEAERILARLHDQREARIDILRRLLLTLDHRGMSGSAADAEGMGG